MRYTLAIERGGQRSIKGGAADRGHGEADFLRRRAIFGARVRYQPSVNNRDRAIELVSIRRLLWLWLLLLLLLLKLLLSMRG